jgi:hypothetical protein
MGKLFLPVSMIILVIIFAPFGYIWALNTLFPSLNISYSSDTWLAMVMVHLFFHQTITVKK